MFNEIKYTKTFKAVVTLSNGYKYQKWLNVEIMIIVLIIFRLSINVVIMTTSENETHRSH